MNGSQLQCIKMEYQKIANLLDNASNQPSKFRTSNWVEINDESRGTYTGSSIKFKTTMLRSNLCDYADAYILVKGTITITGAGNDDATKQADERGKGVTFKNCAPFTKCINRINNTEIDNAKDIDIVMPMYNLIEYTKMTQMIVIIIQKPLEVYFNTLKIFLMITQQDLNYLNLK